jgi:hypothetical protein
MRFQNGRHNSPGRLRGRHRCCAQQFQIIGLVRCRMKKEFKSNHLGPISWFLGIGVDRHADGSITLNEERYVQKLIEKFVPNYASSRAHSCPCDVSTFEKLGLATSRIERSKMASLPYLKLIGSLLYLSTITRPDIHIACHMSILCSFMRDPSPDCYAAALN